ncbi:MAG: response regulator, partial [Anaerolineales bacterium]
GRKSRTEQFASSEQEALRLMARWVGSVIEQEQYLNQLQTYSEEIVRANKELAIARDQALESSRLKSEFLATMSHEIRTPLNAVIGMAELLLETPLNQEQREYSEIVRESAQVLLGLINDILDFSKIEAGKLELEEIDFEPLQIIESAVEIFSVKAREKNLSLMSGVSPEIRAVLCGDPMRIKQVLINLIGNAVKFTERGEVLVTAEIAEQTVDDLLLRFEVKDTGVGLSASARERLFQPFTQADGSTTRQYGGTGLGLVISKRIIEMMGGEIGVESVEGKGSTFWFTVRLRRSGFPISNAPLVYQDLVGTHALIVDDNQNHRLILRRYMESWGMVCKEAPDAQSALKMINSALQEGMLYDVAIIDLQLPDMDGFSLAEEIHSSEITPALVALTAFDQRGMEDMAMRRGFAAFITKPVKRGILFQVLCSAKLGKPLISKHKPSSEKAYDFENVVIQPETKQKVAPTTRKIILLAEDNPANQKLAKVQLEKLGFQVETAENGQKALQAYLQAPYKFALILMDCQMPEMDGFTATRLIRDEEMKRGLHIPIVAMTANAMQGDREACIAAGMDDYISKPVTLPSLSEAIHRWLRTKETALPTLEKAPQPLEDIEPLDYNMLNNIRELQTEGEADFLTELIDIYLEDSNILMERIQDGIIGGDFQDARKALHSLKGTSANLGVRSIAAACSELEKLLERDDHEAAQARLPKLREVYQRACEALRAERR